MLFNFNTPRQNHQRLQFLYSESTSLSHLLLFRHKESIDVYAIHTGPGQQGIEIVDPAPHSEEIVGRFIWSQFDLSRQSIYFLYLRSSQQNSLGYDTMLKCVQFTSKNRYDVKMDIMLPMETLWAGFADFKTKYVPSPCSHSLLFTPFNMEVVHMDNGGICVCFQHAPASAPTDAADGTHHKEASASTPQAPVPSLSYSIFVLHHGCTLVYTVPLPTLTWQLLPQMRLHFSAFHGFLLAYIPGHVMQLVDCGTKHEPCHHIVDLGAGVPTLPGYTEADPTKPEAPPQITYFELVKQDNGRNAYGVAMFDVQKGIAYTYSLNSEAIFDLFASGTASLASQVLTLHLVLVHLANASLTRRIIEFFFAENSDRLHTRLLKEYLIGQSYMSMKQHSGEDEFLRLLPQSSITTYYEELHGGAAGNDFSQECPLNYVYSRLDPHAVLDGTCGKAIQGDTYDSLTVQKGEHEVSRFTFDVLHDTAGPRLERLKSQREQRRLARKDSMGSFASSPSKLRERSESGEKRSFFASIKKGKFFSLGSKSNSPTESRPPLSSTPATSRMDALQSDFNSTMTFARHEVAVPSPNAPPDEEARLLQKRMLHYLHRHLQRFCPEATAEQCLDWANDYHNCQFLQSTEVFRSMMNVRTSPETVAACRAAVNRKNTPSNEVRLTKSVLQAAFEGKPRASPSSDFVMASQIPRRVASIASTVPTPAITEVDNERVLFRLMEKLYFVIQVRDCSVSFSHSRQLCLLESPTAGVLEK